MWECNKSRTKRHEHYYESNIISENALDEFTKIPSDSLTKVSPLTI